MMRKESKRERPPHNDPRREGWEGERKEVRAGASLYNFFAAV